jgi:hypothetical protein
MRIFYSFRQVDEVLSTLRKMKNELGSLNPMYAKFVKDTLKNSYKGVVIYFYNELSKYPEVFKEFESIQ